MAEISKFCNECGNNDNWLRTFTLQNGQSSACTTIEWMNETKKVKINGIPALPETSVEACKSTQNIPQGTAVVTALRRR